MLTSSLNLERVVLGRWEHLTPAEAASVSLVVRGLSNRSAASARGVSASTFVNQLSAAYRKLGVMSRRELRARFGHYRNPAHESSCTAASPAALSSRMRSRGAQALTRREQEVLSYASAGYANKVIAAQLAVAISTVSTTLTRARRKGRVLAVVSD
jgi:DNA-binding CsgD family transcriptional regulator